MAFWGILRDKTKTNGIPRGSQYIHMPMVLHGISRGTSHGNLREPTTQIYVQWYLDILYAFETRREMAVLCSRY